MGTLHGQQAVRTGGSALLITCYAMFTCTRTADLDGFFLFTQSELFR